MRFFASVLAICALLNFSNSVYANEELEAQKACERTMVLFNIERERKGQKAVINPDMCSINTRPSSFWNCASGRMANGESFAFATNQCTLKLNSNG